MAEFPLGTPVNRPPQRDPWRPIPHHPDWFKHERTGEEKYVERNPPPKEDVDVELFPHCEAEE